jgi:hypothetical protein
MKNLFSLQRSDMLIENDCGISDVLQRSTIKRKKHPEFM